MDRPTIRGTIRTAQGRIYTSRLVIENLPIQRNTAFGVYVTQWYETFHKKYPEKNYNEIQAMLHVQWQAESAEKKQLFQELAEEYNSRLKINN